MADPIKAATASPLAATHQAASAQQPLERVVGPQISLENANAHGAAAQRTIQAPGNQAMAGAFDPNRAPVVSKPLRDSPDEQPPYVEATQRESWPLFLLLAIPRAVGGIMSAMGGLFWGEDPKDAFVESAAPLDRVMPWQNADETFGVTDVPF